MDSIIIQQITDSMKTKYVIGDSIENETIEGITKGNKYKVTREGKDEYEVINDDGDILIYCKSCFELE